MTRRQRRALVFRRRMALVCAVLLLVLCGIGIWNLRQRNHAPKSEYTISDACEAYRTEVEELADQYGIAPEEAEANIDPEALNWKLKRDKALRLILDSAVTDEEGKKELDRRREDLKKDMEKRVEIRNENESS